MTLIISSPLRHRAVGAGYSSIILHQALVHMIESMGMHHSLAGRMMMYTTDCEHSMEKAGRLRQEHKVCVHIGCYIHRFESSTGIVFDGPGVKSMTTLDCVMVTRYWKSGQVADRLGGIFRTGMLPNALKFVHDVKTTWWRTFAVVDRLSTRKIRLSYTSKWTKLTLCALPQTGTFCDC